MAQLSASEIKKYDWRPEVFIRKMKEKSKFEVSGGQRVEIKYTQQAESILRGGNSTELNQLRLESTNGKQYKLSDFVKTSEFGGKGEGSGTLKEDRALASLRDQINAAKIADGTSTIKITIKNKTYDVFDVVSTPGTPKSDFHFVDINGNEIAWISHKDGRTAKDFQQWGGMSERNEPKIHVHPEVKDYIAEIKKMYPNGLPNATTVGRDIKERQLKMMAIYGNEFGGQYSRQNVTLMLQGDVKLNKLGQTYNVTAYHTHYNGDEMRGDYEPIFMAIYKGDRSDFGIRGTRVVIAPRGCRKITKMI